MTAYENGLKASDTRFLLKPDYSDFFRFFGSPAGKGSGAPAAATATPAGTTAGAAAPASKP
jgi:membrane protease subunit HflC